MARRISRRRASNLDAAKSDLLRAALRPTTPSNPIARTGNDVRSIDRTHVGKASTRGIPRINQQEFSNHHAQHQPHEARSHGLRSARRRRRVLVVAAPARSLVGSVSELRRRQRPGGLLRRQWSGGFLRRQRQRGGSRGGRDGDERSGWLLRRGGRSHRSGRLLWGQRCGGQQRRSRSSRGGFDGNRGCGADDHDACHHGSRDHHNHARCDHARCDHTCGDHTRRGHTHRDHARCDHATPAALRRGLRASTFPCP